MRLYLDMDGVLCHFAKKAQETWGFPEKEDGWYDIEDHHWDMIDQKPEFWSEMEWQPGGRELWDATKHLDPWLLTAYNIQVMQSTIVGKLGWVKSELAIPLWKTKLVMREDKQHYARNPDGSRNILIDDSKKNIREWFDQGGLAIYHGGDVSDTLHHLKNITTGRIPTEYGLLLNLPATQE